MFAVDIKCSSVAKFNTFYIMTCDNHVN